MQTLSLEMQASTVYQLNIVQVLLYTSIDPADKRLGAYSIYLLEPGIIKGKELIEKQTVIFNRAKLTNSFAWSIHSSQKNTVWLGKFLDPQDVNLAQMLATFVPECPISYFMLQSFHSYQPRFHIIDLRKANRIQSGTLVSTVIYPQTQFIGVTHYQNQQVNYLKKQYNPHAKGFREYVPHSSTRATNEYEESEEDNGDDDGDDDDNNDRDGEETDLEDTENPATTVKGNPNHNVILPIVQQMSFEQVLKTGIAGYLYGGSRARRDSNSSRSSVSSLGSMLEQPTTATFVTTSTTSSSSSSSVKRRGRPKRKQQ